MPKTNKSVKRDAAFYIGLASAVYHAVVHAGIVANVDIPWWVGAAGVALSAAFMYLSGMMTGKAASYGPSIPAAAADSALPGMAELPRIEGGTAWNGRAYGLAEQELMINDAPDREPAAPPDEEERED